MPKYMGMSRVVVGLAALLLLVGSACTSPHHRADLVRSTAQQAPDSADETTTTSLASGPAAADAPVYVAPGNDPTPRLVTTARRSSGVAARPAVATAPSRPVARPASARGGSVFPTPGPGPKELGVA